MQSKDLPEEELNNLKLIITSKIKELPDACTALKTLKEIEELLQDSNAGGRVNIIKGQLKQVGDPAVTAAQKELSKYLLSMDVTPQDRRELFSLWRADKLIDVDKLLTIGKKSTFTDFVTNYNTNLAIKELVDDVMNVEALGQGRGEFGLSVLSKHINKQPNKGDLLINRRAIEVKTTSKDSPRFTDQNVRPGAGFEEAATELNATIANIGISLPASGINLRKFIKTYHATSDATLKSKLFAQVTQVITLIFNGEDVTLILAAISTNNPTAALQEYAKTNFNYYMNMKKDEGVLYIGMNKKPIITIFFSTTQQLADSGMRLHASTPYLTAIKDQRLPYPQTSVVPTTR